MHKPPQTLKGYVNLVIAGLTCPCHLPIILAVLGGTAFGAFLRNNILLLILILTAIFLFTLFKGLKLINQTKERSESSDHL